MGQDRPLGIRFLNDIQCVAGGSMLGYVRLSMEAVSESGLVDEQGCILSIVAEVEAGARVTRIYDFKWILIFFLLIQQAPVRMRAMEGFNSDHLVKARVLLQVLDSRLRSFAIRLEVFNSFFHCCIIELFVKGSYALVIFIPPARTIFKILFIGLLPHIVLVVVLGFRIELIGRHKLYHIRMLQRIFHKHLHPFHHRCWRYHVYLVFDGGLSFFLLQ